jgi:hypothetical protein
MLLQSAEAAETALGFDIWYMMRILITLTILYITYCIDLSNMEL